MSDQYVLEITPQRCGPMFGRWDKYTTDDDLLRTRPADIALVVFSGGHDVSPALYGENRGRYTQPSAARDEYETEMFDLARAANIPLVGICRGSQFLCVKAGGRLVQDLRGHNGNHTIRTADGRLIVCNSSHHQMQLPPADAEVLAWAEPRLSTHYLNGDNQPFDVEREVEVVHYPAIRAVGIQYHPEWLPSTDPCVLYALEVVAQRLFPT